MEWLLIIILCVICPPVGFILLGLILTTGTIIGVAELNSENK